MSHVDEGLLHAYVDGAFAPGEAQAAEIEAHLASCPDCRVRLEDARALKDRAHEVLRNATPIDVQVPPFEALRARTQGGSGAGTPATRLVDEPVARRRRGMHPPVRLAWAASVVLAISAGWMANELVRRDVGQDATVRSAVVSGTDARAEAEPRSAPLRRERSGEADTGAAIQAAPTGSSDTRGAEQNIERPSQADPPAPPPAAVTVAPTRPSGEPRPLARTAQGLADPEPAEKLAGSDAARSLADRDSEREPMSAMAETLRRRARAAAQGEAEPVTPTPTVPQADMARAAITQALFRAGDVVRLDTMPPALADGRAFGGHVALVNDYTAAVERGLWSNATTEQAASALGGAPARIENVPPVETEIAAVDGRVLVRERYVLEDGTSLELVQRPAALTLPGAEATVFRDRGDGATVLPPNGVPLQDLGESSLAFRGASAVALSRSGLVLLLKGPVPHDLLHSIATRIR